MYYFLCWSEMNGVEVCFASGMCSYVLLCPSPYQRSVVLLRSGCMYGLYMNVTAWYGDVIINTFGAVGEIEEVCFWLRPVRCFPSSCTLSLLCGLVAFRVYVWVVYEFD